MTKEEHLKNAVSAAIDGQAEAFIDAATEYVAEVIVEKVYDDTESSPESEFDNASENLYVYVLDALIAADPDDNAPEAKADPLFASLEARRDRVISDAEDRLADERAYSRDTYGYHGVKRSDFF